MSAITKQPACELHFTLCLSQIPLNNKKGKMTQNYSKLYQILKIIMNAGFNFEKTQARVELLTSKDF